MTPITAYGQPIFNIEVTGHGKPFTTRLGLGMTEFEAVEFFANEAIRFASIRCRLRLFTQAGREIPGGKWRIAETTLAVAGG